MDPGPEPLERPVAEVRDGKRTLVLKNLDKVWWPEEGITKGDVLDHYHALADVVGPHLRGRPFTMLRFPDGIAGKHFFQKDAARATRPSGCTSRRSRRAAGRSASRCSTTSCRSCGPSTWAAST